MDQRSFERMHLRCPVVFSWKADHERCFGRGETHDISATGFLIFAEDTFPAEGSLLRCDVQLGSPGAGGAAMVMRTVGKVRRTEPFDAPGGAAFAVQIADEGARICLDSGDVDTAYKWYKMGHDTGLEELNITPVRRDLWDFRWEHAQARIAARRGNQPEAEKHVAAAKAILDKGTIPEQLQFFPYLKGYVAFYRGDYNGALEGLKKANQNDPFIQYMIGQTYDKLGYKAKAAEYYRKVLNTPFHNPAAAYAVPLARKRLS